MTHHPDHEVELYRDEGVYRVFVDLPGFDRGDVDLRWHDGRLSISAERRGADVGEARVFHHTVTVPRDVDAGGIRATHRDGVLDVELPIADGAGRPGRRIDVSE